MNTISKSPPRPWLLYISIAILLGAFIIQYAEDLRNLVGRWGGDFDYCYLVPFLFLYLAFSKRAELRSLEKSPSLLGFGVLFFSSLLYLTGKLGSMVTLTFISLWVAIIGITFLLFGWKTVRALAYPFVVLAFMIPIPPFINNLLTFNIKLVSSSLSAKMMQAIGLSVFQEGNIIDMGIMQLQVVDACSGLRYVYPLLLMGLVVAYLFHKRWWERGIIILATIPISIIANALRISMTGFLAVYVSKEMADGFFHGFSSWLIFMATLVILAMLSISLMFTGKKKKKDKDHDNSQDRAGSMEQNKGYRLSFLWIASIMFLIVWGLHANLAADQIIQARKTFDEFPTDMGPWKGEKILLRDEILNSLWADDYIQVQYRNSVNQAVLLLLIPYYEIQGVRNTAHSPVSCLVGSGYAPVRREIISRELPEPLGKVQIRQMVLEKEGSWLLSNYWFQQRGRWIVSEYMNKWYLFWDSITKGRADGALVRIEMPLHKGQDVDAAQAILDEFTLLLEEVLSEFVRRIAGFVCAESTLRVRAMTGNYVPSRGKHARHAR